MSVVKEKVCDRCLSPYIIDIDCVCAIDWKNANYIELEFEKCDCCGHLSDQPLESEFNNQQLESNG